MRRLIHVLFIFCFATSLAAAPPEKPEKINAEKWAEVLRKRLGDDHKAALVAKALVIDCRCDNFIGPGFVGAENRPLNRLQEDQLVEISDRVLAAMKSLKMANTSENTVVNTAHFADQALIKAEAKLSEDGKLEGGVRFKHHSVQLLAEKHF